MKLYKFYPATQSVVYICLIISAAAQWHYDFEDYYQPSIGGFINPSGPTPEIYIEEFSMRYKRQAYGLDYEIPATCKTVASSTENRVTKG